MYHGQAICLCVSSVVGMMLLGVCLKKKRRDSSETEEKIASNNHTDLSSLDPSRLPANVQYRMVQHMCAIDAISFMQVFGNFWPCSRSKFFKTIGPHYLACKVLQCPTISLEPNMYNIGNLCFSQKNSMRTYLKIIWDSFTTEVLDRVCCQYYSSVFQCYVRLFSFNVHFSTNNLPLFDIVDHYDLLQTRELNDVETELFKVSQCAPSEQDVLWITTAEEFMLNLKDRFGYDEWYGLVNMDFFVQAGTQIHSLIILKQLLRFFFHSRRIRPSMHAAARIQLLETGR